MMSVTVNEKTLTAVLTEKDDRSQMIALLNEIIDEELAKDEMNTDLVDECVEAIMDLESGAAECTLTSYQTLIRYCHSSTFKKRIKLRRAALIAAVTAIAASATLSASPALAEQTKDIISSIMVSLGIAADSTDTGKNEIVSIYAVPKDNIAFTVKSEDEIRPENVDIVAVDKYNFEKRIPLSECKVQRERMDSSRVMVTYAYEGCACSIIYHLEVTS